MNSEHDQKKECVKIPADPKPKKSKASTSAL